MAFAPDTEQGATFALATLTMDIAVTEIPAITEEIPVIAVPVLATTGQVPYIPGDLSDVPEFTVTFMNDGDSTLPTKGAVYTCTITGPVPAGLSSGEIQAGSVICTKVGAPKYTANSNAAQSRQLSFKPNGGQGGTTAWTRTAAA